MKHELKNRAIKYQLFPTIEQEILLAKTFGCCRLVYNIGIEMQSGLYAAQQGRMSAIDLNNYCNRYLKADHPFLKEVDKFALSNSLKAAEAGFKNFFEGRAGYPKFKGRKNTTQSYSTNMTNGNIKIIPPKKKSSKRGQLQLPKLGIVDACVYRQPAADWIIKSATISKTAAGRYYASVLFAFSVQQPVAVTPRQERTIGLDYSSPHFYVDSLGNKAGIPHYYRQAEERLAQEQRKLSLMARGSNNYTKQRQRVARLHERTANLRRDFTHQLSRKITNSYDAVCVEDINLRGMAGALKLGKSTNDNGFGMFRTMLQYKLEEQGKHFVVIDKWFPSSKTCHACGGYHPELRLGEDLWVCPNCGETILRDYNAALNIRDEGFRIITAA